MMRRIALATVAAFAAISGTAMAADITYTGANGAWSTGANWDLGRVPAAGDVVRIPAGKEVTLSTAASVDSVQAPGTLKLAGGTLTLASASSVARLDQSSGTITGAGELTIGSGTWSGGAMAGSGTTRVTGTLTHAANSALNDTRVLAIEGTLNMAGGYINDSGTPVVRNSGTIKRTAPAAVQIYAAIDNDGLVDGVDLEGGGSGSTGAFTAVRFANNVTFDLADGAALTNVTLAGATLNVAGTVTASGTMTGGTVGGAGTLHVNGPFTWSGGAMAGTGTTRVTSTLTHSGNTALNDTRVLAVEGTLNMAGGYINDSGTPVVRNTGTIRRTAASDVQIYAAIDNDGHVEGVSLEGGGAGSIGEFAAVKFANNVTFELAGGATLVGATISGATLNAVGTVTASGATTMSSGTLGGTGTFVLGGTFAWSGGTMTGAGTTRVTGTLTHTQSTSLAAGRVLAIEGTLDMAGAGRTINGSGGATIHVTGTFKRTGTGANSTTAAVDNDGLVRDVELNGGGKDVSTGEFVGAAFKSGTFALGQGARVTGDSAIAAGTVNVTGTVPVAGRFTGGTLGGTGTPEITGTLEWTGGTMAGPGTTRIAEGGTLVLNGISSLATGRVLENRGLIDARGLSALFDDFDAPDERVENLGTIRKTAGASTTLGVPLHNAGLIDGKVGELRLDAGTGEPDTGTFTGTDAANRVVFDGERVFTGAVQLTGTSELAEDVTVRAGDTLTVGGTVLQRAGTLRGDVTITGRLNWDGGRHSGPGTTTVGAGGRIVVTRLGTFGCGTASLGDARRLVVAGVLRLENGADLSTFGQPRPVIENAGRIELESRSDDACGDSSGISGDALLRNTGTIEKVGGTSGAHLRLVVDNAGTINGPLELESDSTVTQSGTFKDVTLADGVLELGPTAALAGTTTIADGELRVGAPRTVGSLKQTGGGISGPGSLTVAGTFAWSGGDQAGPGATVLAAGATGTVTGNAGLDADRELINRGTLTLDDATLFMGSGASVSNAGLLVLDGAAKLDDSAFRYGYGDAGLVHNTGTLRKTGTGAAVGEATIDNDGAIEVLDGRLELPELLNWSGSLFGGTGTLVGGSYVVGNGAALLLPGGLKANAARLALGAGSQVLYTENTGTGAVARDGLGGLLRNAAAGTLELTGGRSLTVTGTFVNQGVLALGAGSTLNAGGFTQSAGAVLRPTLTAASAGRVAVTGAAQLGGRLDTVAPAPVAGDVAVVTGAVSGTFGAVTGGYEPTYGPGSVTVRRAGGEEPAAASPAAPVAMAAPVTAAAAPEVVRTGRTLKVVVRTCPTCGSVRVSWAGITRTVSLKTKKGGRRTITVVRLKRARTGTVRVSRAVERVIVTR